MTLPFCRVDDEDGAHLLATSPEAAAAPVALLPSLAVVATPTTPRHATPASPRLASTAASSPGPSPGGPAVTGCRARMLAVSGVPEVVVDCDTPSAEAGGGLALAADFAGAPVPVSKRYPLERRLRVTLSEEDAGLPLSELPPGARPEASPSDDAADADDEEAEARRGWRRCSSRAGSHPGFGRSANNGDGGADSGPPSASTRRKRFNQSRSGDRSHTLSRDEESLIRGPSRTEQVSCLSATSYTAKLALVPPVFQGKITLNT